MPVSSDVDMWAARLALLGLMARIDAIEGKKFVPQGELDAAARLASTLARAAAGEVRGPLPKLFTYPAAGG